MQKQAPKPRDTVASLQAKLEKIVRGKCGRASDGVIQTFDHMRDVRRERSLGYDKATVHFNFYAGDPVVRDTDAVIDDFASLCRVSIFLDEHHVANPPEGVDTVESMREKVRLATDMDWSIV